MSNDLGGDWKQERPPQRNPAREPGPIDLQRFRALPHYAGIPTFMGVPLCMNQEDLKAGQVDVAILGAPVDSSSGQRGAAFGPRYIRCDERTLWHNPRAMINPDTRVRPFATLKVVDYGDAPVDPFSIDNSMEPIRAMVREVAEIGAVPIILGGDHSILWPNAAAIADVYGPGKVGVVHFDTHADCSSSFLGHLASHGTPVARLIEDEHIPGKNFVQVGLHSFAQPDEQLMAWMRERGMRTHYMAEIDRIGFAAVLEKAIEEALDGPEYIYLSIDIDVLDPAFAPGTGTPEAGGLTPRELLPAIRRICHETQVVGMDIVEVAPHLDPGYTTAMYARRAVLEALSGMAQRRLEIPGKRYLHPIAAGEE
ncbi:agmatinase family protein [Candidatus Thiothrix sp. Deng01]|uniref:Agmatinase family protein n=1 Tax=Candidatus Thiothrix phosphatis TaxID=3112415 RepID=A0ABU6CWP6_9GAMM|nr:agmatinase family protein [Candidatus Thiothrix sp. Deng01]MEB4591249.1 agmatinase family protein [Candidatus Thiothrix sp. Deng01]